MVGRLLSYWVSVTFQGRAVKLQERISIFTQKYCFKHYLHSGKLKWQWKNGPFEDVFPIENGDFPASYVSLPEGNPHP